MEPDHLRRRLPTVDLSRPVEKLESPKGYVVRDAHGELNVVRAHDSDMAANVGDVLQTFDLNHGKPEVGLASLPIIREPWSTYTAVGSGNESAVGWQTKNEVHVRWAKPTRDDMARGFAKHLPAPWMARALALVVAVLLVALPGVWPYLRRKTLRHEIEHAIQPDFSGNMHHHDSKRWLAEEGRRPHVCGRCTSWLGAFSHKHLRTPMRLVREAENGNVILAPVLPGSSAWPYRTQGENLA